MFDLNKAQDKKKKDKTSDYFNREAFLKVADADLAMVVDNQGRYKQILAVNEQMLYKPKEELIGTKVSEALPHFFY